MRYVIFSLIFHAGEAWANHQHAGMPEDAVHVIDIRYVDDTPIQHIGIVKIGRNKGMFLRACYKLISRELNTSLISAESDLLKALEREHGAIVIVEPWFDKGLGWEILGGWYADLYYPHKNELRTISCDEDEQEINIEDCIAVIDLQDAIAKAR